MPADKMLIEILPDGTLKISIDPVSSANHGNAETMLRSIIEAQGGTVETKHRHGKKMHSHSHTEMAKHRH